MRTASRQAFKRWSSNRYKYHEVEPREREAVAKPKAKSAPKAKSVLKRPGEAILC